jgi:hypothetical protein
MKEESAGALAVIDAEHAGIDLSLRTTPADRCCSGGDHRSRK